MHTLHSQNHIRLTSTLILHIICTRPHESREELAHLLSCRSCSPSWLSHARHPNRSTQGFGGDAAPARHRHVRVTVLWRHPHRGTGRGLLHQHGSHGGRGLGPRDDVVLGARGRRVHDGGEARAARRTAHGGHVSGVEAQDDRGATATGLMVERLHRHRLRGRRRPVRSCRLREASRVPESTGAIPSSPYTAPLCLSWGTRLRGTMQRARRSACYLPTHSLTTTVACLREIVEELVWRDVCGQTAHDHLGLAPCRLPHARRGA
eukprot:scaffold130700_cov57-Phaeocystis_antarctica.AAC.1